MQIIFLRNRFHEKIENVSFFSIFSLMCTQHHLHLRIPTFKNGFQSIPFCIYRIRIFVNNMGLVWVKIQNLVKNYS